MKHLVSVAVVCLVAVPYASGQPHKKLVTDLKNPAGITVGPGGKVYVTDTGERGKANDGTVLVVENGKSVVFCGGLNAPTAIVGFQNWLFVAEANRVMRIDAKGKSAVLAAADAFPIPPKSLNVITVDVETGTLYVGDLGEKDGKGGAAIFRITPNGKVSVVADAKSLPEHSLPVGLAMDGQSHLLVSDGGAEAVYRIKLSDGSREKIVEKAGWCHSLVWDRFGR